MGANKRAWEIRAICPVGDRKPFLSSSLWEGDLAGAETHFQENKCEGERPGPPALAPQAAPPGLAQWLRARQTDGPPPGAALGTSTPAAAGQTEESVFGEYFRNSNERELVQPLLAHGAEKGLLSSWVTENTGTPEGSALLRLAAPRVCSSASTAPPGGLTLQ